MSLASKTITPDVCKKYSEKYKKEIKNANDRLAVLEKDSSSNFDFIDKCMVLASTLSCLHRKFGFRQRKKMAKAIFNKIWAIDKEIRKVTLNPLFDFSLKDQTGKAHSIFPNLEFEHHPLKSTEKEKFEGLLNSICSSSVHLIESLINGSENKSIEKSHQ